MLLLGWDCPQLGELLPLESWLCQEPDQNKSYLVVGAWSGRQPFVEVGCEYMSPVHHLQIRNVVQVQRIIEVSYTIL